MSFHKLRKAGVVGAALTAAFSASSAQAYDWNVQAHVTVIEPTYMPDRIGFQIDMAASSSCPAGSWLTWPAQGADQPSKIANVQAILASLLTAKLNGKLLNLFGSNASCTVSFMHVL